MTLTTFTPFPHQAEACSAVLQALSSGSRACVVLPCGTGKTLIGALLDDAYAPRTLLLLFPSIALIAQTLESWRAYGALKDRNLLCVCSDKSVQGDIDAVDYTEQELGVLISTTPDEIRSLVQPLGSAPLVIFSTYHSAALLADALRGLREIDLAIFDEAHRTVSTNGGAFSFALDDRNLPIAKRVFLTATPRHVLAPGEDRDSGAFSMDNTQVYGPIAYTLSLREAVARGLIADYEVLVSAVSSDDVSRLLSAESAVADTHSSAALTLASAVALSKAMHETGAKKVFSFHRTVAAAQRFAQDPTVLAELDCEVLHINGRMTSHDRQAVLARFAAAERAVITNARCLTEGIDVPAVDMIFFADPKSSVIDIVQAVGRAQRKTENKRVGYVLLPAHIDARASANEDDRAGALNNSHLHAIFNVLSRLTEQENVVAWTQDSERTKTQTTAAESIPYRILADQSQIDLLRRSIDVFYTAKTRSQWDENFALLKAFAGRTGNANPTDKQLPELATWLRHVRFQYKRGGLDDQRVAALESIGFCWDGREAAWRQRLEEWKAGTTGTRWERNQREEYRKGTLPAARLAALQEAGFVIDPLADKAQQQCNRFIAGWTDKPSNACELDAPGLLLAFASGLCRNDMSDRAVASIGRLLHAIEHSELARVLNASSTLIWVPDVSWVTRLCEKGQRVFIPTHCYAIENFVPVRRFSPRAEVCENSVVRFTDLQARPVDALESVLREIPLQEGNRTVCVQTQSADVWLYAAVAVANAILSGDETRAGRLALSLSLSVELMNGAVLRATDCLPDFLSYLRTEGVATSESESGDPLDLVSRRLALAFSRWEDAISSESEADLLGALVEVLEGGYARSAKRSAFTILELVADKGSFDAQLNLALALSKGDGCQQDDVKAVSLFENIVENAPASCAKAESLCCLADAYAMGSGVAPDQSKALALYLEAIGAFAQAGKLPSLNEGEQRALAGARARCSFGFGMLLERLWRENNGADHQILIAARHYEYAAKNGVVQAKTNLALLPSVQGLRLSKQRRMGLLESASKEGDSLAASILQDLLAA